MQLINFNVVAVTNAGTINNIVTYGKVSSNILVGENATLDNPTCNSSFVGINNGVIYRSGAVITYTGNIGNEENKIQIKVEGEDVKSNLIMGGLAYENKGIIDSSYNLSRWDGLTRDTDVYSDVEYFSEDQSYLVKVDRDANATVQNYTTYVYELDTNDRYSYSHYGIDSTKYSTKGVFIESKENGVVVSGAYALADNSDGLCLLLVQNAHSIEASSDGKVYVTFRPEANTSIDVLKTVKKHVANETSPEYNTIAEISDGVNTYTFKSKEEVTGESGEQHIVEDFLPANVSHETINTRSLIYNLNDSDALTTFFLSATINTKLSFSKPNSLNLAKISGVINLAILPLTAWPSNLNQAKPLALYFLISSVNLSISLREYLLALGLITHLTMPPSLIALSNTTKFISLAILVISFSSKPNLKSGLSLPYNAIESSNLILLNGVTKSIFITSLNIFLNIPSIKE